MTSLYEKLKETQDFLEDAKIKSLKEKEEAELDKLKKEKQDIEKFVSGLQSKIIEKIENGKIPTVKIDNYDRIKWIKDAQENKAKFSSIWNNMVLYFKSERLQVKVTDDHDGMGMKIWIVVSVDLVKNGYRGIQPPSSETHGLKFDLDVGEYRG